MPQSANKHDSPMRSTINELNIFTLNSSDDASTLADNFVQLKKKNECVKCQGFRPEIENIYCNYPIQMHSSILLKTNDEKKFVFEAGTFHTEDCQINNYHFCNYHHYHVCIVNSKFIII